MNTLSMLKGKLDEAKVADKKYYLSVDLETRSDYIACCGISWSKLDAISIPFMCTDAERKEGYFTHLEEVNVIKRILDVLQHDSAYIIGQNFLYDAQYIASNWFAFVPAHFDTMLAQHCAFPTMPKALDFLASMYCEFYRYWKDDGKKWDWNMPEEQLWIYNCDDCVNTFEAAGVLQGVITQLKLEEPWTFQTRMVSHVLMCMLRGVKIDLMRRSNLELTMMDAIVQYELWFHNLLLPDVHITKKGNKPWYRSPIQQAQIFYDALGIAPVKNRKTGGRTCDDAALTTIAKREPIVKPITDAMANYRSVCTLNSNFIQAKLDPDNRIRCSYNLAGTDTFRLSSSENAFGRGMNLQTITAGEEVDEDGEPLTQHDNERHFTLPNLRQCFIPDAGKMIADIDLERADLQVVIWEADDDELKDIIKSGLNYHIENAKAIFGGNPVKSSAPDSPYHKAKAGVHAVNYGCKPKTLAGVLGITVSEADRFIQRWFEAHPKIKKWHIRIEEELMATRSVSNKFGNKIRYFDRMSGLLPQALAWVPQSTVGLVINKGWANVADNLPWVDVLMQVHDSLVVQFPVSRKDDSQQILDQMTIIIPYADPLRIPCSMKASFNNWGEC